MSDDDENELVAWLASLGRADGRTLIGIGDDMAMVAAPGGRVLVTADMLMDGVDFDTTVHTPEQIGRKALAASLSDCAAMAVRPCWALVSLALPKTWTLERAKGLYRGMEPLAEAFDCQLIGGDTNTWEQPLAIDVVILAEPHGGIAPVTRRGARAGDVLGVTGRLGGSLSGHHLEFEPRVAEAERLARHWGDALHAMMDLSDGLSVDAARMAKTSGCGMEFDELALAVVASPAAIVASRSDGRSVLDHVLIDGADFELLAAAAPEGVARPPAGVEILPIGQAVTGSGVWIRGKDGSRKPLEPRGWRHRLSR